MALARQLSVAAVGGRLSSGLTAAALCGMLAERMRLTTERLALREFQGSDGERVYAIESDPESVVYQSFGPRTREESLDYARRHSMDQHRQERDTWDLVVTLHGSDEMIGRCGLGLTGDEPGEAVLWYQFDRAVWGRGYATEAARAVVDAGFTALGLHRIWADCDPRHVGSIRVLEKVGFRREGHLVENAWIKGEWVDSLIYALLRREWRPWKSVAQRRFAFRVPTDVHPRGREPGSPH